MTSMAKKHSNYARADDAYTAACRACWAAEADAATPPLDAHSDLAKRRDAARVAFFAARKALTEEAES